MTAQTGRQVRLCHGVVPPFSGTCHDFAHTLHRTPVGKESALAPWNHQRKRAPPDQAL